MQIVNIQRAKFNIWPELIKIGKYYSKHPIKDPVVSLSDWQAHVLATINDCPQAVENDDHDIRDKIRNDQVLQQLTNTLYLNKSPQNVNEKQYQARIGPRILDFVDKHRDSSKKGSEKPKVEKVNHHDSVELQCFQSVNVILVPNKNKNEMTFCTNMNKITTFIIANRMFTFIN